MVERSSAVQGPARVLNLLEELVLADVLGLLEHHVLEQVRETGPAWFFPAGANVVQHRNCGDGIRSVLVEDDLEPVVELVRLVVDGEGGLLGTGRYGEHQWGQGEHWTETHGISYVSIGGAKDRLPLRYRWCTGLG